MVITVLCFLPKPYVGNGHVWQGVLDVLIILLLLTRLLFITIIIVIIDNNNNDNNIHGLYVKDGQPQSFEAYAMFWVQYQFLPAVQ